jgi:hypothetical protein
MVWASLEVNSLFGNLRRALLKPNGLTSKTHSKCWMSKTGGKPGPERARLTMHVVGKYVTDSEWHEECTEDC